MEYFYIRNEHLHSEKYCIDKNYNNKIVIEKLITIDLGKYIALINSFKNEIVIILNEHIKFITNIKSEHFKIMLETPEKNNIDRFINLVNLSNVKDKFVSFIFAVTYCCNLNCKYCYQQHDKTLLKKPISLEDLDHSLCVIQDIIDENKNLKIDLGLFGGEPLLKQNENIIDIIFEFCKKNAITVNITSNGVCLDYYLKKLIINRNFISSINLTIDNYKFNEKTRNSEIKLNENSGIYILERIKILIDYNVNVILSTNIDNNNLFYLEDFYLFLRNNSFFKYDSFKWVIGRVDDRLYETNYDKIIPESDIIKEILQIQRKYEDYVNITPAFIKSSYNLCNILGFGLKQYEIRGEYNYCWASSNIDNVYYIDNQLNTFRCTYTVGRLNYSIFKFSKENIVEDLKNKNNCFSYLDYEDCINCRFGGFCSGGCRLSACSNFERNCSYEKFSINKFIDEVFTEELKKFLYKEGIYEIQ